MTTLLTLAACLAAFVVGLYLGRRSALVRPSPRVGDPPREDRPEAFEDTVVELDRELVIARARGESILGHAMSSLVGRSVLDLVAEVDRGPVLAILHLALEAREGEQHAFEADWIRNEEKATGRVAGAIRHNGHTECPLAVRLTDVTQHHAVAKELERQVGLLRAAAATARESIEFNLGALEGLLDHSPWAVVITDLDGRFVLVNDEAADWLGARREDLIGRLESELHDVDTAERIRQSDERLLANGLPQHSRNAIRRNGETIEYEVSKVLLRRNGKPVAIAGMAARVTADAPPSAAELFAHEGAAIAQRAQLHQAHDRQRRAESEADQMARRFQELAGSVPLALCILDRRAGEIEYANARFASLLGNQAAEFGACTDAILAHVLMEDRTALQRLLRCGEECDGIGVRLQDDEVTRLRIRTISADSDDPERVLVVAEDVTNAERVDARRQTDETLMSLIRLAGGIAHDFNNALSPIITSTELARSAFVAGDRLSTAASLEDLAEAGDKANRLVDGILELSHRPEEPSLTEIHLHELFESVARKTEMAAPSQVEFRIDETKLAVTGDTDLLGRALSYLCSNAIEARKGDEKAVIDLTAHIPEEAPESVDISVRDAGCGIPGSHIQRIFDPLFTTKGFHSGFGIGLTLVHDILERLDGSIEVDSDVGKATVFRMRLPRAEQSVPAPAPDTPRVESGAGESILLVDDDPLVLRSTARSLECLGYEVTTASSGEEAMRRCETIASDFDLVLTDHGMDGMSGFELCLQIGERWPELPRLLATGLRGNHPASDMNAAGISGVLLKPFSLDDLRRSVREALESEA